MRAKKTITKQQVKYIIEKYRIRLGTFTIRENGLIDVNGNVKICYTDLSKLPLKFGNVYGDFFCHSNKLATLKGCPAYVAGDFNCFGNNLKSLKYGPAEVGGDYFCHENSLISLEGSPKTINKNFNCFLNQIKKLKYGPIHVNGSYYAYQNELVSIEGAPDFVGLAFHITGNTINDLVGCPTFIGDIFSFDNDVKLYLGKRNCNVKKVVIQAQEVIPVSAKTISQIVIDNQKHLSIVFKYINFLDLYNKDGGFNESDFNNIILDIKEGLR